MPNRAVNHPFFPDYIINKIDEIRFVERWLTLREMRFAEILFVNGDGNVMPETSILGSSSTRVNISKNNTGPVRQG